MPAKTWNLVKLVVITCGCQAMVAPATAAAEEVAERATRGLVVLYDFADSTGAVVRDRAGSRDPIDLTIENLDQVRRRKGSLDVQADTLIRSDKRPRRLVSAIKRSGALTVEAWIRPRHEDQSGPARIVTLSKDASLRNFTLGQDGNQFDVRLRAEATTDNGQPSLASKSWRLAEGAIHFVYTRNSEGSATIWLNGQRNSTSKLEGGLSNWDNSMHLALGNEIDGARGWLGTFYLVGIYSRALSAKEVQQNYRAGAGAAAPPLLVKRSRDPHEIHFELEVAPIIANQCLECHDSLASQGGLDLSKKQAALRGGDSGAALVAKNSADSLLWQSVEADTMPHERPPLSQRNKQTIKKWIDDGAVWTLGSIDPAVYVHGGRPDTNWVRRLTVAEYIATVRSLFDIDISEEATELLPPDVRADGFSNTAYNLHVELKHIEAYQQLAEIIVEQIDVDGFSKRYKQRIRFTDDDMGALIKKMGRSILRGPLETREVIHYRGISTTMAATEAGTLREAIGLTIEAMLQSPRFIYRVERQRGDGSAQPVDGFELASRMSYMIWGAPPDEPLYRAASDGDLFHGPSLRAQAVRMLDDPRAIAQSERFFSDWLNLPRLNNLQPNRERFPDWDPALAVDMRKESVAFFHDVAWSQNRPLSDLLNAQVTFATPRLARHYGLPPEAAVLAKSDGELIRYDLTKITARGGLLTQGNLLTVGGDEASMVTRGLMIMHELLRGVVKDPPPCVDTTPVPSKPGQSQRAISEDRIANATCGGCHRRFEPLAFGLEKFDGLGGFHEVDEHGNALRDDGQIVFPGATESVSYRSAGELMDLMAASERVQESITWKLTQFVLGRPLTAADAGAVQAIHTQAWKSGGTYRATLVEIVSSDLVTMMQTDLDK